jgi:hypothetical protein
MNYIVVNGDGLNVRSQMNTTNSKNLLRRMSNNEGFVVHETYNVQGMSGLQVWGRVSDNPGGISQEYVCLQIGNKVYAKEQTSQPTQPVSNAWQTAIDTWARSQGYTGPRP